MRQLIPLPLVTPGNFGMNKQNETSLLPPGFCTHASNMVFDHDNRLSARAGLVDSTTTPITSTPTIEQIHEFRKADGTVAIISAANNKVWTGVNSFTDITGSVVTTSNNWQFMNFEDKCVGVLQGETPIIYTGSGNFAVIVAGSGTAPTGNCGVAAFGRLWIADSDRKTVKFCGLLDETDWGGVGAGSIGMEEIWDVDEIQGIAAAFGRLLVFGRRSIVVFADSIGSTVGLDPANLYVEDIINGTGLAARDSIQNIGEGDLWFLSPTGVQSLVRVIQEKNNPLTTVSGNIRDYIVSLVNVTTGNIRSVYDVSNSHYILLFPTGKQICVHADFALENGAYRVTEWTMPRVQCAVYRTNKDLLFGMTLGEIATYSGNTDLGSNFNIHYESGWLALGDDIEAFTKILKKWTSTLYVIGNSSVTFKVYKDFEGTPAVVKYASLFADGGADWNSAEFGIGEFSGGLTLREINLNLGKTAQYIKLSLEASVNNTLAIQKFNIISKRGRMNT